MKRLIRLEKERLRKATIERIREQERISCKLFWADLKGKTKQCQIQRVRDNDGVVVEKRKDVLVGLGKVFLLGEDVPNDNLESEAKEVN